MKYVIVCIGLMVLGVFVGFYTAESGERTDYIEVEVEPHDTLWKIANAHYDQSHDIRQVIHNIKSINRLESTVIHPGETLRLPQY